MSAYSIVQVPGWGARTEIVDVDGRLALREETVESADPEAEPLATHPGRRVTYTVSAPDSSSGCSMRT
jgi:hypothetical protein